MMSGDKKFWGGFTVVVVAIAAIWFFKGGSCSPKKDQTAKTVQTIEEAAPTPVSLEEVQMLVQGLHESLPADQLFLSKLKTMLLADPAFLAAICDSCKEQQTAAAIKPVVVPKIPPLKPRGKKTADVKTFAGDQKTPAAAPAPPCPKPPCDTNIQPVPEGTAPVFAGDHNQ